jgi:prepilin-type N-terminal cleavage/methylation domain-containing protein
MRQSGKGFTLIEMMVAVALLVIIMGALGVVFRAVSRTTTIAQANLEAMGNVAATADQLRADLRAVDRTGFMVIRSRVGVYGRADQICFTATNVFPHRTGNSSSTPFAESLRASTAAVWYGHLAFSTQPNEATPLPTNDALLDDPHATVHLGTRAPQYTIGREAMLLVPSQGAGAGNVTIAGTSTTVLPQLALSPALGANPSSADSSFAHVTSGRFDAVAEVLPQLVVDMRANRPTNSRYDADAYCYRFQTLAAPGDTEIQNGGAPSLINGYFRMHTICLQAAPSFQIEWSDGTPDASGALNWYGLGRAKLAGYPGTTNATEVPPAQAQTGDAYTAVFDGQNGTSWPRAIKITVTVTDPRDVLNGGRTATAIFSVPQ